MAKRSLLLVDGDTRSLRVLEVSLKKAGFTVTTAADGIAALEIVDVSPPDLIISNTSLEGLDGFDFCRAVKDNPSLSSTPFVFLTDQTEIEHKIRGLELGVDEYLIKPIYIKEILTRVRILLQKAERNTLEGRDKPNTRFTGKLRDMGVVDLIQTVEVSGKSGVSHFTAPRGAVASLYFRDGRVIDAELGPLSGADAVYRLLTWNHGDFEVLFRSVRRRDVINLSPQALLMEGMRRLDEWGRLLEQLPPLSTRFEVAYSELSERLAELPDELNQLLRLFDGYRSLMDIVDQTPQADLESLELIAKLYFEGLVLESEQPVPTSETWPPLLADREDPIDLPPARVRAAEPEELEHDPGDDVYVDLEVNGVADSELDESAASADDGSSTRRKPHRRKSLVDIAIGEVAPVFPGLELGFKRMPTAPPEPLIKAAEATPHEHDLSGVSEGIPIPGMGTPPVETVPPELLAELTEAIPQPRVGEDPASLARMNTARREVAMIPTLIEKVRHQGDRDDRARKISSQPPPIPKRARAKTSKPPIEVAPEALEELAPEALEELASDLLEEVEDNRPTLSVVPDLAPDSEAAETDDANETPKEEATGGADEVEDYPPVEADGEVTPVIAVPARDNYPAFEEETPTPQAVEVQPLPPSGLASSEPSSLRVISSDGAEIVAVAGAISSLESLTSETASQGGSIVIEDEELRQTEEPSVEEPTVEEPLGQRARRGSSAPPPLEDDEKRSPLLFYFAVAGAALLFAFMFLLLGGEDKGTEADAGPPSTLATLAADSSPHTLLDAAIEQPVVTASADAAVIDIDVVQPFIEEPAPPTPRERAKDLRRRASTARGRGRMKEALALINEAVQLRPTGRNMAHRADILYALGRNKEAIIAATAAVRKAPGSSSAWKTKGLAHFESKQWGAAKSAFERYLKLQPTGSSAASIRTLYQSIDQ